MSEEISKYIEGNKKFKEKFFANKENSLYSNLTQFGQSPKTLVITCSDSRIDPAMLFDCQPGELFVIRNVANLIPPSEENDASYHGTSAALEFAVCFLEIKNIIVLGHTQCGGIQSLIENSNNLLNKKSHGFIAKWMEIARPAYDLIMKEHENISIEEKVVLCEQYALINSLNNIYSFEWIKEKVNSNKLEIFIWYFDLKTGNIYNYHQEKKNWLLL